MEFFRPTSSYTACINLRSQFPDALTCDPNQPTNDNVHIHICVNIFFKPFRHNEFGALSISPFCLSTRRLWVLAIDSVSVISYCPQQLWLCLYTTLHLGECPNVVINIYFLCFFVGPFGHIFCWSIWQRVYDCVSLKGRLLLCCPLTFTTLQQHLARNTF